MLTEEDIKQFQELYKKHFGIELSYQDACDEALKLVTGVGIVYKPISQEDVSRLADILKQ